MSFFSHKKDKEASSPVQSAEPMPAVVEVPSTMSQEEPSTTESPMEFSTTQCQTSTHLMSYPLVKETVEFVEKIPGVETMEKTTKPIVEFMQGQSLIKPVIETVDNVGNYTLDLSESVAPCLKTVGYEDIVNTAEAPIIAASDAIVKSTQWTTEAVQNKVCSPTRQMVMDFRSYYNKHIYDTKGKPLVRSSMDPIFRPVNNYMESLGEKWLPESEPLKGEFSSEIEKNMFLSYDLTKRSIPVVINKKMEVVMAPFNYAGHAFDVFNENWSKEASSYMSPLNATYNSTVDLTTEAWSTAMKAVGYVWGSNNDAAQETDAEPIEATAEDVHVPEAPLADDPAQA